MSRQVVDMYELAIDVKELKFAAANAGLRTMNPHLLGTMVYIIDSLVKAVANIEDRLQNLEPSDDPEDRR